MVNSRNKGAGFERDIINAFKEFLGVDCKRNLEQWRSGGDDIDLPPYSIECKRRATIAIYDWWHQACDSAEAKKRVPILIVKADRKKPLVVMDLREFMKLIREEVSHP
jgi:hypothetical protein